VVYSVNCGEESLDDEDPKPARAATVTALTENGGGLKQPQEPLGALLVERGLITPEQLTVALAEQKSSGQPLGAIVVAHGFAAPASVAQALATQHGGLLKTEYGFATGFGNGHQGPLSIGEPPVSSPRIGPKRPSGSSFTVDPPAPRAAEVDREAVRSELELASQETERLADANARLAEVRADLEQRLATERQRASSLESAITERDSQISELTAGAVAWQNAYNDLEGRLVQSTEHAESLAGEVEQLKSAAAACEAARGELERELAQEVERAESLRAQLAAAEEVRISAESSDSVRVELEARLAEITGRATALEAEVAAAQELRASASESSELERRLAEAGEQLRSAHAVRAELEERLARATEGAAQLEAQVAAAEELRASALASERARGELEARLATVEAELAGQNEELEHLREVVAFRWAAAERHLLFFQGADGYELVERDGPPPTPGTKVGEHVVARVAAGAVPGELPCAYLVD
jgi:uncharacterized coiled-coil protein SlyX